MGPNLASEINNVSVELLSQKMIYGEFFRQCASEFIRARYCRIKQI